MSLLLFSCNKKNEERIILIRGMSTVPFEKRIGIEIDENNNVFYCIETAFNSGKYSYFHCKMDIDIFDFYKGVFLKFFSTDTIAKQAIDASEYEFYIKTNNMVRRTVFYDNTLNEVQYVFIKQLEKLVELSCDTINYYSFPERLLIEKLPTPPAPPNGVNSRR